MSELGQCGRFTLKRKIGAGGMGEIFYAEDPDGRPVAIKRLLKECAKDPVFVGMFLDEARLVETMSHPNVCDVREHGMEGSHYFLVMEYIDGLSLAQLLQKRGSLPVPLACRIVAEVASGLDYAHRLEDEEGNPLRTVHRDVTPANIMIAQDGAVKLVDFGLAKARTQIMKTRPGLVKGKFGYLSPEQLAGHVDFRTDIFALGLCLFESLRGTMLFDQKTAAATVQAIQRFDGPPPLAGEVEGVPSSLDAVLQRALARSPEARFESAAAFRSALGGVVIELGSENASARALAEMIRRITRPPPPPASAKISDAPPARPAWQIPVAIGAGVGLTVLLLLAVALALR